MRRLRLGASPERLARETRPAAAQTGSRCHQFKELLPSFMGLRPPVNYEKFGRAGVPARHHFLPHRYVGRALPAMWGAPCTPPHELFKAGVGSLPPNLG
jgi:hypothetical protein